MVLTASPHNLCARNLPRQRVEFLEETDGGKQKEKEREVIKGTEKKKAEPNQIKRREETLTHTQ